jgi:hypothetical protein
LGFDDGVGTDHAQLVPGGSVHPAGRSTPIIGEDLSGEMCELYRRVAIFAHEEPVRRVVDRVERLQPQWIHAMHGGTLAGKILPRFAAALREQPFALQGSLLGRALPLDAMIS